MARPAAVLFPPTPTSELLPLLDWLLFLRARGQARDDAVMAAASLLDRAEGADPPSPTTSSSGPPLSPLSAEAAAASASAASAAAAALGGVATGVLWTEDAWDSAREAEAAARVSAQGGLRAKSTYYRGWYQKMAKSYWNAFYVHNGDRFFKDRHYLGRDFPALAAAALVGDGGGCGGVAAPAAAAATATPPPIPPSSMTTLFELGCGCGNSLLPLVAALPRLAVTGFDLSRRAVDIIRAHPLASGGGRILAFPGDATAPDLFGAVWAAQEEALVAAPTDSAAARPGVAAVQAVRCRPPLSPGFDFSLLLFVLSAMAPEAHAGIVANAAASLRPGGRLLFRDYAFGDEAQLRFKHGHRLGEDALCVRSDGTLSYYFRAEEIARLARGAGLEVEELRPLYRRYVSRVVRPAAGDGAGAAAGGGEEEEKEEEEEVGVEEGAAAAGGGKGAAGGGLVLRRVFLHAVLRKPHEVGPATPFW
jgi:SAM-dependent methyltransferase